MSASIGTLLLLVTLLAEGLSLPTTLDPLAEPTTDSTFSSQPLQKLSVPDTGVPEPLASPNTDLKSVEGHIAVNPPSSSAILFPDEDSNRDTSVTVEELEVRSFGRPWSGNIHFPRWNHRRNCHFGPRKRTLVWPCRSSRQEWQLPSRHSGARRPASSQFLFPDEEVPTQATPPKETSETTTQLSVVTSKVTMQPDEDQKKHVENTTPATGNKESSTSETKQDAIIFGGPTSPPSGWNLTHPTPKTPSSSPKTPASSGDHSAKPRTAAILECGGEPYNAFNNQTGDCQELWSTTNCGDGEWFVLNHDTHEAACVARRCPKHQLFFNGRCHTEESASEMCPAGMTVFLSQYGDAFCDCSKQHIYWPSHKRCYPAFRRGPCARGEQLLLPPKLNTAICVPNPCPDGQTLWSQEEVSENTPSASQGTIIAANTASCFPLEDADNSPCPPGRLEVDIFTLQLSCERILLQAIFNPPKVRCAPGSQLDFSGNCRKELFQKFRNRLLVIGSKGDPLPTSSSVCPEGFKLTPDKRCIRPRRISPDDSKPSLCPKGFKMTSGGRCINIALGFGGLG